MKTNRTKSMWLNSGEFRKGSADTNKGQIFISMEVTFFSWLKLMDFTTFQQLSRWYNSRAPLYHILPLYHQRKQTIWFVRVACIHWKISVLCMINSHLMFTKQKSLQYIHCVFVCYLQPSLWGHRLKYGRFFFSSVKRRTTTSSGEVTTSLKQIVENTLVVLTLLTCYKFTLSDEEWIYLTFHYSPSFANNWLLSVLGRLEHNGCTLKVISAPQTEDPPSTCLFLLWGSQNRREWMVCSTMNGRLETDSAADAHTHTHAVTLRQAGWRQRF